MAVTDTGPLGLDHVTVVPGEPDLPVRTDDGEPRREPRVPRHR